PLLHFVRPFVNLSDLGIAVDRLERPALLGSLDAAGKPLSATGLDGIPRDIHGKSTALDLRHRREHLSIARAIGHLACLLVKRARRFDLERVLRKPKLPELHGTDGFAIHRA